MAPTWRMSGTDGSDEARWWLHAACRDWPPEWWYQDDASTTPMAKRICAACPVRIPCLDTALTAELATGVSIGIWGGVSADGRARMVAAMRNGD